MKKTFLIFLSIVILLVFGGLTGFAEGDVFDVNKQSETEWSDAPNALQIEEMRKVEYPGSEIVIEETLAAGNNYDQYVVSYLSEGAKIYALLTVPFGDAPESGWPVIIFNHGYIDPGIYRTTERYVAYVNAIASHGYIVLKPDFRGHGFSEGEVVNGGGYGTPGYTVDVLNAVASIKMFEGADANRIGMWGHSMGGQVTLRAMVVSDEIKAGVIWGGVVAPYPDVIESWDYRRNAIFSALMDAGFGANTSDGNWLREFSDWVMAFSGEYGTWEENPEFWASISPNSYLDDLSGPIQLDHSLDDEMVPVAWSTTLAEQLQAAGVPYEFYTYRKDNHNISENFGVAMQRSINFFDMYVKGIEVSAE